MDKIKTGQSFDLTGIQPRLTVKRKRFDTPIRSNRPSREHPIQRGTADLKENDQALIDQLSVSEYKGKPERAFIIRVATWDKNCPQHITPR